MKERVGIKTHWLVVQDFDVLDPFAQAMTYKDLPILGGARYAWTMSGVGIDGFPEVNQVANTQGLIGQWVIWPGKSPRVLTQINTIFAAKITTASPLKATPVKSATGGTPTMAADLDELAVSTLDGSSPTIGTFGVVVAGSDLTKQSTLFFAGGVGSAVYKITVNSGGGVYKGKPVDYPGASLGSEVSNLKELNSSVSVPAGQFVECTLRPDGNYWFSMPFGAC